jgi:hypothetical protein
MEECWYGSAILDLDLSTRLKSSVIFTAKTLYPLLPQKEPLYPLYMRLGGLQSWSWGCGVVKYLFFLLGIELQPCNSFYRLRH